MGEILGKSQTDEGRIDRRLSEREWERTGGSERGEESLRNRAKVRRGTFRGQVGCHDPLSGRVEG